MFACCKGYAYAFAVGAEQAESLREGKWRISGTSREPPSFPSYPLSRAWASRDSRKIRVVESPRGRRHGVTRPGVGVWLSGGGADEESNDGNDGGEKARGCARPITRDSGGGGAQAGCGRGGTFACVHSRAAKLAWRCRHANIPALFHRVKTTKQRGRRGRVNGSQGSDARRRALGGSEMC